MTGKKKDGEVPSFKNIVSYDEDKYDFYNRTIMMMDHIWPFISDCEYAAFEGYAFGANGDLCQIAEFASQIKFQIIRNGTKLRLYSPLQIKQSAGDGKFKKPEMETAFHNLQLTNFNIADLPKIPTHSRGKNIGQKNISGISPTSDIIDSFFICRLLYNELLLRENKKIPDTIEKILKNKTKNNKIPLYQQGFIKYDN